MLYTYEQKVVIKVLPCTKKKRRRKKRQDRFSDTVHLLSVLCSGHRSYPPKSALWCSLYAASREGFQCCPSPWDLATFPSSHRKCLGRHVGAGVSLLQHSFSCSSAVVSGVPCHLSRVLFSWGSVCFIPGYTWQGSHLHFYCWKDLCWECSPCLARRRGCQSTAVASLPLPCPGEHPVRAVPAGCKLEMRSNAPSPYQEPSIEW